MNSCRVGINKDLHHVPVHLVLNSEDRGNIFLRNVGNESQDHNPEPEGPQMSYHQNVFVFVVLLIPERPVMIFVYCVTDTNAHFTQAANITYYLVRKCFLWRN